MSGKEKQVMGTISGEPSLGRDQAVHSDLPKPRTTNGEALAGGAAASGEGVTEMLGRLRLTPQEATPFVLDDVGDDLGCPEWALIGKVLTPNKFHISTIQSALRPAWGNPKGLDFKPCGVNMFLAVFANEADKKRIKSGSPWNVGKNAVILNEFDHRISPSEVRFEKLAVWARILNLPFSLMNDQRGKAFVSRLGTVEKMEVDESGRAWGEFLRVRVVIDVTQPLIRCLSVFSQSRQATDFYTVMYENLPTFCYSCGMFGHSSLICPSPADRDEEGHLPYHGPSLCVPDERKKKHTGTNFGQSSYSNRQGSQTDAGRSGQPSQIPRASASQNRDKNGTGEITSPVKPKKTRARKPKDTDTGKGAALASTEGTRVSGQKRKIYRPKTVAIPETTVTNGGPLMILPTADTEVLTTISQATGNGGEEIVAEPSKKQRLSVSNLDDRSADLAAAVEQPRPTQ
jgi:hypothetical protein